MQRDKTLKSKPILVEIDLREVAMEEEVVKGSSSSSSPSISRWNPTREQVMVLEGLFMEGMRTPNAEQIREITRRLRVFGAAEGKNVFYWFQNHKARIRQKRKQEERFAILSQIRRQQPMPMPMPMMLPVPSPAVISMPFYPQGQTNGLVAPYVLPQLTQQQVGINSGPPNLYFPRPVKMVANQLEASNSEAYGPMHLHNIPRRCSGEFAASRESVSPETLQLFPLQPNGTGRDEKSGSSLTSSAFVEDGEGGGEGRDDNVVPFFDFFGPSQGNK